MFEEDYSRWQIYDGILRSSGREGKTAFESCVRFLHSGVPRVRTWVNYHPTQGGSHLKGLGRALKDLFPDQAGCRLLPLVVNPDSGETIKLPHSLVGALHVRMEAPRYEGPTKDVVVSQEIENFIYERSRDQFARQLPRMKGLRAL